MQAYTSRLMLLGAILLAGLSKAGTGQSKSYVFFTLPSLTSLRSKFYETTEEFKQAFYAGELEQQTLNTEYTIDGVSTLSTNRPDLPSLYMDDLVCHLCLSAIKG